VTCLPPAQALLHRVRSHRPSGKQRRHQRQRGLMIDAFTSLLPCPRNSTLLPFNCGMMKRLLHCFNSLCVIGLRQTVPDCRTELRCADARFPARNRSYPGGSCGSVRAITRAGQSRRRRHLEETRIPEILPVQEFSTAATSTARISFPIRCS
jgi:hypothetical protein